MGNELMSFEKETLAVVTAIATLEKQMKEIEAQEKEMRASLQAAMEKYGVKSWSNAQLSVTYKEPYTRTGIDANKLLVKYPEAYHECEKLTNVKGSITIKVK